MDRRAVRRARHPPVERVDFAHQMALAESADRRVARHRPDQRRIETDERDARAEPRGGGGGLGPGVSTTDDDDIESSATLHDGGALSAKRAANPPKCDRCDVSRGTSFPDTEASEQGVEHLLDPGASCNAIERRCSEPKPLCNKD